MAASEVAGTTTVHNRVYPLTSSELDGLKGFVLANIDLINDLNVLLKQRNEQIAELFKEKELLKQKLDDQNKLIDEINARDKSVDVLPFTSVTSTLLSGMGDLSTAELPEQQEVQPKIRRSRRISFKHPSPGPLELYQTIKLQKTKRTRAKSANILPFTSVSSTCSSDMGDLSSAELPEQQEVQPKIRRSRRISLKHPSPGPLELYQTIKLQKTRRTRAKSANILPFTSVSSTCPSNMGDLSSAELPEQQEVQPKIRRTHRISLKHPNPDPSALNRTVKLQKTRRTRAKFANMEEVQEVSMISVNSCQGNYEPEKQQVPTKKGIHGKDFKNLKIHTLRIKTNSRWYSVESTENDDGIFENKHSRWDMQQIEESRWMENSKEDRNVRNSQSSKEDEKKELTSLSTNPAHIKVNEITNLPVSAFGCNLRIKKTPKLFKFYHSKWYNDGSVNVTSQENNMRRLRSSTRGQFNNII